MTPSFRTTVPSVLSLALAGAGCTLLPAGYDEEREAALHAGETYAAPFEARVLPELPPEATWHDAVERALLANGELEAAYFEWRAAVERVPGAASWPNSALMPSFSVLVSGDSATLWERTTLGVGFDGAENLELPAKTRAAAEVALESARAAGARFRTARQALRREVLERWLDLALAEERARVARADRELLEVAASTAAARTRSGGPQGALLEAEIAVRAAENRERSALAEAGAARARLNALLARAPDAALGVGAEGGLLPEPRPVPEDTVLLAVVLAGNPELAELHARIAEGEDALELARLMFLPNVNPFANLTGNAARVVGAMIMLPTTLPEIRAGIAEARAALAGARALARQAHHDHAGHLVAALVVLRDSAREAELFETGVLPAARLLARSAQQAYASGEAELDALIDAQRTLLEVRLVIAEARIERERRVAEIEEIAGADMEALVASAEVPR